MNTRTRGSIPHPDGGTSRPTVVEFEQRQVVPVSPGYMNYHPDLHRAIREMVERSMPTEAQIGALRSYQNQLDKIASGSPARQYLEEMNRAVERARKPYENIEELRRALENAVRPFTYLQETVEQTHLELAAAFGRINASIAEATFLGEIELGTGEVGGATEEKVGESAQEELEEQLREVAPSHVVSELKRVEFVPLYVLDQILRAPEAMRELSSYEFEMFVATLVDNIGFEDAEITPKSRDGGRHILAVKRVHGIPVLFAFECKRYSPDRPVGVEPLKALWSTISRESTKANKGVLVTTSRFTSGARKFLFTEPSLEGKDFNSIVEWLGEYATSRPSSRSKDQRRKRLSDLYGALPATRPFPGKQEIREEVGRELGKALRGKRP